MHETTHRAEPDMGACLANAFRGMRSPLAVHRFVYDEGGRPTDHVFVHVNEGFELLTGLERDGILGRPVRAVLSERGVEDADWTAVYATTADVTAAHFTGFFEQDGRWHQVDTYSPCSDYFVAVFTDFTDAVDTLEVVQQARDYYEQMFNDFPALIWRTDPEGRCDYFNNAWLELRGRTLAEESGDGWHEGVHPEDLGRVLETLRSAIERHEPFEVEHRIRRNDGAYRWIAANGTPFHSPRGELLGFIGACHDVSGRVEHLVQLHEYQSQLKALAVMQADTRQRERRALAVQLHDRVSTPLAAARIRLQLLARDDHDERSASDPMEALLALIDEAMQESRAITTELGPPLLYELGLLPALEWLGERFEEDFGLRCEIVDSGEVRTGTETAALAFRAVRELLANVAAHAGVDRARVALESDAGGLTVRVSDEGRGFGVHLRKGFGLMSLREAVEASSGTLEVVSAEGAGTNVTLRLPLG